jgi:hypothetical protein
VNSSTPTDDGALETWEASFDEQFRQLLTGEWRPPSDEERDRLRLELVYHDLLRLGHRDLALKLMAAGVNNAPLEEERENFWRLAELLANPDLLKVPAPISPIMAYEGRLTIVSGREKLAGKSTLASWDLSVASHSMPVLWVTYEESLGDVVRRLHEFSADPNSTFVLDRPKSWETEAKIRELAIEYVVIDSFAAWVGHEYGRSPATSESEEWQKLTLQLKDLAHRTGAAVCTLAHTAKSDHKGGIRGNTGIAAAADFMVQIANPISSEPRNQRRLSFLGRWSVEPMKVKYEGDHFATDRDLPFQTLGLVPRVYAFVEADGGPSTREVRDNVRGDNNKISEALAELVDMGAIEKVKEGRGYAYLTNPLWVPDASGEGLVYQHEDGTDLDYEIRGEA